METTSNFFSGVGATLDNVVTSVSGKSSGRDPFLENVSGMTRNERELAASLHVDPYSDFVPLREALADVARAMTAGNISVSAAFSAIPGGAGIAVSGSSTASDISGEVREQTSSEIADLVTKKLDALKIDSAITAKFVGNHSYSPSDQLAIAKSLETLNAANSDIFVSRASDATGADAAKLFRYRAEFLAQNNASLGTLKSFVVVSNVVINRDNSGRLVAAFVFDDVAWTEKVSRSITRLSADIAKLGEPNPPAFATAGSLSAKTVSELNRLGWKVLSLAQAP